MNNLSLFTDPLGDLYVEWKFRTAELITIDLPHYKYEMSNLLGIPVPFSSIAEKLETEVVKVSADGEEINYTIEKKFRGGGQLIVPANIQERELLIQYVIRNLVTRDKIFFNFVFTLNSPLSAPIATDIELNARFSYDINSYKLRAARISPVTGRIESNANLLTHQRTGDYIQATGTAVVIGSDCIDLHVHASRLPFMIDRRIFWLVIFTIAAIGMGTIISLLKGK